MAHGWLEDEEGTEPSGGRLLRSGVPPPLFDVGGPSHRRTWRQARRIDRHELSPATTTPSPRPPPKTHGLHSPSPSLSTTRTPPRTPTPSRRAQRAQGEEEEAA
uniref:Uncharacterized protein n=1 Tax=Oryza barthii TaxID=65489 RepID=A0A0D3GXQ0_9ORYZ